MRCAQFRENIHDFIDCRLDGKMMIAFDAHLGVCEACRKLHGEFIVLRELISERLTLPAASAGIVVKRVRRARRWAFLHHLVDTADRLWTTWRDMEPRVLWATLSAIPITLSLFLLILHSMAPLKVENLNLLAMTLERIHASQSQNRKVEIRSVEFRQDRAKFRNLMDTAWRLPYEDSLSLVAGITPEGNAEIDNVLEYPKSEALLDAVDVVLRKSQMKSAGQDSPAFLIFSFQKIDVYEDARGL